MRGLLAAIAAAALAFVQANDVWPMPPTFQQGSSTTFVDPSFRISCAAASPVCPDPLSAAFTRYQNMVFWAGQPVPLTGTNKITGLQVIVGSEATLALGVDESYNLTVPVTGVAQITSNTQWGALRGLETFAQLTAWAGNGAPTAYAIDSAPVKIADAPRFQWRGTLIDTSRHYLGVDTILATLDAMSYNKMNVMHWHIVDDNSWPLQSLRYPNFTVGAYAPNAIYTHADVTTITDAAWERGIMVVPEFDLPAHSIAWGTGYPDLIISCPNGQSLADPTPTGQVYATVAGLLEEFMPLFRNSFIHFGGDEVENLNCWASSPKVQAFMKEMGYTAVDQVRNYFETTLQQIAANYSLTPLFWEEVYDGGYTLAPSTIIDVWLSDQELLNIIRSGNRVVESYGLYLDQQLPPGDTHYFWVDTFTNFWTHDPLAGANVTAEEAARVLGMSASQWGEQVDDANIFSRMWPRACAAAERMWSPATWTDDSQLFTRIEKMRCTMMRRGIGAGPVRPADEVGYCALPASSPILHRRVDWSAAQA